MKLNRTISRRDFLKLGGAGLLGLLMAELGLDRAPAHAVGNSSLEGRVAFLEVPVYDEPSFQGNSYNTLYKDSVIPISGKVLGGMPEDYNRTWYRIGESGYVHSGGIQLVENVLNPVISDIPASGMLGELSVPFAEAWWGIHRTDPAIAYRVYYQSTHWILDVFRDPRDTSPWYRVYDHLYDANYYIRPSYIRLIPPEQLSPLSADIPPEEKHIEVLLDQQMLVAYEFEEPVYMARTATGKQGAETPTGRFTTFHKRPTAHMAGGDGISSLYDLAGVPFASYITDTAIAFHGTFWHNDFGKPRSFGCINLSPKDARWIFRWTLPTIPPERYFLYEPGTGTEVLIGENHSHILHLRKIRNLIRRTIT